MFLPRTSLLAIGLSLLLPWYVVAQESSPSSGTEKGMGQPKQTEKTTVESKTQESQKQGTDLPTSTSSDSTAVDPSTRKSAMSTKSGQTLISARSITNSKVLDSDNKEIGAVQNVMVDPKSGSLVRADISLGSGVLGIGTGNQQMSVPWDQLTLKRQQDRFVLVLNQEVVDKIRTQEKQSTRAKKDQSDQQQRDTSSTQRKSNQQPGAESTQ